MASAELDVVVNTRDAEKSLASLERAFSGLKTVAVAALAAFGAKSLVDALGAGIDAANQQQEALARLGQQMKLTGEFSSGAVDAFASFADEMERNLGIGDDVILNQLAIAKSFNTTNEEARRLVSAAAELSAATGDSLESSVDALGKTLSGTAGQLSKTIPELKGLSKEALVAGDAINIVLERFGGSAAAKVETFAGSVLKTRNAFGNLLESFGEVVIKNPAVISLIQRLGEAFNDLTSFVSDNSESLSSGLTKSISLAATGLSKLTEPAKFVVGTLRGMFEAASVLSGAFLQIISTVLKFDVVQKAFKGVIDTILNLVQTTIDASGIINSTIQGLFEAIGVKLPDDNIKFFAKLSLKVEELRREVKASNLVEFADDATQALADFQVRGTEAFDKVILGLDKAGIAAKEYADKIILQDERAVRSAEKSGKDRIDAGRRVFESEEDLAAKRAKLAEEEEKKAKEFRDRIANIAANPIDILLSVKTVGDFGKSEFAAIAAGIGAAILDGAKGAQQLITGTIGAVVDRFIPGLGAIVKQILDVFAGGPDVVKGFVKSFVEATPQIIENLAVGIPALVEGLVESLINEGGIVRIAVALVRAMTGVATLEYIGTRIGEEMGISFGDRFNINVKESANKFGQSVSETFQRVSTLTNSQIADGFANAAKNAGSTISNAIKKAFTDIASFFTDFFSRIARTLGNIQLPTIKTPGWLQSFIDAIERLSSFSNPLGGGGGGGGGGLVSGTGTPLDRLATGGTVPPGFPNDTFGAMLTSGEVVVPKDDVIALRSFLAEQASGSTSGSPGMAEALLTQILRAVSTPQQVSTSITIDGRRLADAILQLNRQNQRLTA